ncbi:ATP-binding protein [Rhizobium oryzicola]|uniref:Winged helix-turn-helix domain-containing protein n=1 Tax=Rhizobium oryzicola TaxID=1232668 RepID=A0ABT8SYD6_9HYPH|nr:winged helix-turn-helix domain-containing protein [Rhizobium oryzicola]MDO1583423.1 winged helix-turn-helix domain-containing protein [Rhizobium oryzicola]
MSGGDVLEFGSFRLSPGARLLSHEGRPIRLGSRALDILICLIRHAGTIVSNEQLILDVWGAVHVEGVSLRVHISELRKALDQFSDADRYIINVPGRGYSFTATVKQQQVLPAASVVTSVASTARFDPLPLRPPKLVGREADVTRIRQELLANRFLSIVGTGGIGKTVLALAVAESLVEEFPDAIVFIDLAPLRDQRMVTTTFATALGLPVRGESETASIIAALESTKILLVVDNCEHVIGAVAELTEKISESAPQVHLLATTREPLRVQGEQVLRLQGLAVPPDDGVISADSVAGYPAVALFVERARAQTDDFQLTDENAAIVAQICRGLDGLALAIELAAGRVATFGVQGIAGYLHQRFNILNRGRRTAHPRHQALRLTLDWSYDLLEEEEKIVLRRLSVFAGTFSLEAAEEITSDGRIGCHDVAEFLSNLVDKSLVAADVTYDEVRFRLLDTTREYATERLKEAAEVATFSRRHAGYFLSMLTQEIQKRPNETVAHLRSDIENVRIALDWSFSEVGELEIAIPLAIAAADLMMDLSLLAECTKWAATALERLPQAQRGTHAEMALLTHFAMPLLFMRGNSEEVGQAIEHALALAQKLGDAVFWSSTMSAVFAFHLRAGNVGGMQEAIRRAEAMSEALQDRGMLESMISIVAFFSSEISKNRLHAERALALLPLKRSNRLVRIGVDFRIWTYTSYVLALWIHGYRDTARAMAQRMVDEAEALGSAVPLATALVWGSVLALWAGDVAVAEQRTQRLLECSTRNALLPYRYVAEGHSGTIAMLKGDVEKGIELLERSVAKLVETKSRVQEILLLGQLTHAYAAAGRYRDARELVEAALSRAENTSTKVNRADFMRLRAVYQWHESGDRKAYVAGLQRALIQARSDGILTVEMRVLVALASMSEEPELSKQALRDLRGVYERFTEALDSPDLIAVRQMLEKG